MLGLSGEDLAGLAGQYPSLCPRPRVASDQGISLASAFSECVRLVSRDRPGEAAELLAQTPLGRGDDLLRLVREHVLALAEGQVAAPANDEVVRRAADVVAAAVADAQAGRRRPDGLALPPPGAGAAAGAPADMGPWDGLVRAILARLHHLDRRDLARLPAAVDDLRASGGWAAAMHTATWAVQLSDRVTEAARAQLRAVRALSRAGLDPVSTAAGGWNLVSGALQATVVRDLLDDAAVARLTTPLTRWLPDLVLTPADPS